MVVIYSPLSRFWEVNPLRFEGDDPWRGDGAGVLLPQESCKSVGNMMVNHGMECGSLVSDTPK